MAKKDKRYMVNIEKESPVDTNRTYQLDGESFNIKTGQMVEVSLWEFLTIKNSGDKFTYVEL